MFQKSSNEVFNICLMYQRYSSDTSVLPTSGSDSRVGNTLLLDETDIQGGKRGKRIIQKSYKFHAY